MAWACSAQKRLQNRVHYSEEIPLVGCPYKLGLKQSKRFRTTWLTIARKNMHSMTAGSIMVRFPIPLNFQHKTLHPYPRGSLLPSTVVLFIAKGLANEVYNISHQLNSTTQILKFDWPALEKMHKPKLPTTKRKTTAPAQHSTHYTIYTSHQTLSCTDNVGKQRLTQDAREQQPSPRRLKPKASPGDM